MHRLPRHNIIRVFEGFAGYGGATFGLRRAGIRHRVVAYSEVDEDAIELYHYNFPNVRNLGDITLLDPNSRRCPDFDLFTGGFPCQPFSTVGKRQGHDKKDPEENNEMLLTELQKYFIVKPCRLGENPEPIFEEVRRGDSGIIPAPEKDGVLSVMMEDYDMKCKNFLQTGKIAVGIKYTKDSMEIVEHLSNIGYVLFHHRNILGQHLFAVKGDCKVSSAKDLEPDRYKNINTTEIYLSVDIDTSVELDASSLNSTKIEWTKATRYDAQFVDIDRLKS